MTRSNYRSNHNSEQDSVVENPKTRFKGFPTRPKHNAVIFVRAERELVERLDDLVREQQSLNPSFVCSRSALVRSILRERIMQSDAEPVFNEQHSS